MARKYRKIDPRIWGDERFVRLPNEEKLIALYCLTSPQCNRIGLFRFSMAAAAEDLGTSSETFEKRFRNVCSTMKWPFDPVSKVLFFPTWWRYNCPENGNILLGNLEDLHDVPNTPLVSEFIDNAQLLAPQYRMKAGKRWKDVPTKEILERFRSVPGEDEETYAKRLGKVVAQEQEQEQEQEQDISGPRGGKKRFIPPTVQEVADYCRERGNGIDAEAFVAHYASKGWMVGRSKMKDWRAAVVTWEKNRDQYSPPTGSSAESLYPDYQK